MECSTYFFDDATLRQRVTSHFCKRIKHSSFIQPNHPPNKHQHSIAMGNLFARLQEMFQGFRRQQRILMLGLDAAGKVVPACAAVRVW